MRWSSELFKMFAFAGFNVTEFAFECLMLKRETLKKVIDLAHQNMFPIPLTRQSATYRVTFESPCIS